MEIAKLRAARLLWAQIMEQYHTKNESSKLMTIDVTNSSWNKTIYDPYVNMLRGTVETMAAALGGAGTITVSPLDSEYKQADEFSLRMARNTQLILKHESYLERIADPSAGSYYIENLTNSIAQESWKLFQDIEAGGGFIKSFKSGVIQKAIHKTRESRDMNIATRKDSFLGVNQFPNLTENILSKIKPHKAPITAKSSGNKIRTEDKLSILFATEYLSSDDVYAGDLLIENSDSEESKVKELTPYRGAQAFERITLVYRKTLQKDRKKAQSFLINHRERIYEKCKGIFQC